MSIDLEQKRKLLNMWLARDGLSRKDLASKLQVSEASVYNWLSCTNIPDKRWQEIKAIFEHEDKSPLANLRAVALAFTKEEHEDLSNMANEANLPLDIFIRQAMLEYRKKKLNSEE